VAARSNANAYSNEDPETTAGTAQYRIAAVRPDGKRSYSNIISLKEEVMQNRVNAYPNPFTNQVKLQLVSEFDAPQSSVSVFNLRGQLINSVPWDLRRGENNLTLYRLNVEPGIYFVRVTDRSGSLITHQRVMKQ